MAKEDSSEGQRRRPDVLASMTSCSCSQRSCPPSFHLVASCRHIEALSRFQHREVRRSAEFHLTSGLVPPGETRRTPPRNKFKKKPPPPQHLCRPYESISLGDVLTWNQITATKCGKSNAYPAESLPRDGHAGNQACYKKLNAKANVAIQKVLTCSNNGMNHFLGIPNGLFMGPTSLLLQGA